MGDVGWLRWGVYEIELSWWVCCDCDCAVERVGEGLGRGSVGGGEGGGWWSVNTLYVGRLQKMVLRVW